MVYQYRKTFSGDASTDSSDWGNFGSYLGAITGLLAFAGAIYAIMNSNKQARLAEERGSFFKMLDLYQKQVVAVNYSNKNGIEAFYLYDKDVNMKITMYIIYNKIVTTSDKYLYFHLYSDDYKSVIKNYNISEDGGVNNNHIDSIRRDISFKKIVVPTNFDSKEGRRYYILSEKIVKDYENESIFYNSAYNTMREVADSVYIDFGYFLGQYYRNIYYLLTMIFESSEGERYSKIFRAQLSRYELVLLLYNAVSSQSSIETVTLLRKYDIFNNIIAEDIFLFENSGFKINIKDFINNLFNEYLKDPRNKEE